MPEPPSRLWLNQARSDIDAARRLFDVANESMYCQAIAKYQQVVEKSVKAIVTAVREAGISTIPTGYAHEVEPLVSALVKPPYREKPGPVTEIKGQIRAFLHEGHRGEIRALGALAPKRPGPGELARRNTEYPFQKPDGAWVAPHESGSFDRSEVERFRDLATRIFEGSSRIVSALERLRRRKQ